MSGSARGSHAISRSATSGQAAEPPAAEEDVEDEDELLDDEVLDDEDVDAAAAGLESELDEPLSLLAAGTEAEEPLRESVR